MGITVGAALETGVLMGCRLVAGDKGLDRVIDYITVMEVPDVIHWLKGNDLLLTSLYPIKENPEAIHSLVQNLVKTGSAALAIKTHRYFDQIPAIILQEANRLDFPVIEIEKDVSYLDIMHPLMSIILDKSTSEQDSLEEFFKWVTELALGGKGIPAILQAVEKFIDNKVTVESELPTLDGILFDAKVPLLTEDEKNELRSSKRPVGMVRRLGDDSIPCIVSPLFLNEELYGYLTCWQIKREIRKLDFVVLERVIPLLALEFLKVKTKLDVELNFKHDFLSEILLGHFEDEVEIIEKAKRYGWDLRQNFQVIILDIDHFQEIIGSYRNDEVKIQGFKTRLLQIIEKFVLNSNQSAIVSLKSDMFVILYPVAKAMTNRDKDLQDQALAFIAQLKQQIKTHRSELTVTGGIGRFYKGLEGIQLGYKEAVMAVELGRSVWGRDSCIHFDDLGIYRILSKFQDRSELESIYSETVGKLVHYDQQHDSSLTQTLVQYFQQNFGLMETAEKLFIHVNTLKYRLQKIEQLTGCRIQDAEGRLQLHLGLKIQSLLK